MNGFSFSFLKLSYFIGIYSNRTFACLISTCCTQKCSGKFLKLIEILLPKIELRINKSNFSINLSNMPLEYWLFIKNDYNCSILSYSKCVLHWTAHILTEQCPSSINKTSTFLLQAATDRVQYKSLQHGTKACGNAQDIVGEVWSENTWVE